MTPSLLSDRPIRILAAIFIADILSMSLMNAFVMRASWLVCVYAVLLSGALYVTNGIDFAQADGARLGRQDRRRLLCALILVWAIFISVRVSFPLEPILGRVIDPACADDYWHIVEIKALINTRYYPPLFPFRRGLYLSHYYAAWMLVVFIYQLLPFSFMTLKCALFLALAIYTLLTLYLVLYTCAHVCDSRIRFYFLLYLVVAYAGAESLFAFIKPLNHNGWWMLSFGFDVQFSSFSTLLLWVPQHLSAAAALFVAYLALKGGESRPGGSFASALVIGCLLTYALYASIFVMMGALPFVVAAAVHSFRRRPFLLASIGLVVAVIGAPMLWIYLNRSPVVGFRFLPFGDRGFDIRTALVFLLYLVVVSLQLMVQVVSLVRLGVAHVLKTWDYILLFLSAGFILSTFFVGFTGANNYACRGLTVPVLMLSFVSSGAAGKRFFPGWMSVAALALFAVGSVNEIAYFQRASFVNMVLNNRRLSARADLLKINMDRRISEITYASIAPLLDAPPSTRDVEKLVFSEPWYYHARREDLELISTGPFGIWKYQRWQ